MIEVHLYGKLRRLAPNRGAAEDSLVTVAAVDGEDVGALLKRLGISDGQVSNIFVNGELSDLGRGVYDRDRVGVFPDDMALLYKWYFRKKKAGGEDEDAG